MVQEGAAATPLEFLLGYTGQAYPYRSSLINESICLKNEFVVRYVESLPQPGVNLIKLLQV